MDGSQLIKVYANRLVRALVPPEFGPEFVQSVGHDLVSVLTSSAHDNSEKHEDINAVTERYKTYFLSQGYREEWAAFQRILESLAQIKSLDQIQSYLVFLSALKENSSPNQPAIPQPTLNPPSMFNPSSDRYTGGGSRGSPALGSSRPFTRSNPQGIHSGTSHPNQELPRSSPFKDNTFTTLDQAIKPYYETLPEDTILTYLPYTLLGLDSKLLSFDADTQIDLPTNVNNSYSGILFEILECALLYKTLHTFIQHHKGKLNSPIKTAFLTVLESQLSTYVNHINKIFSTQPSSIISVYNSTFDWKFKLRLLYSIQSKVIVSNGYNLISQVYELTKFGDPNIKVLTKEIFDTISVPYYEILEHWIINGELIDESEEFFIAFDFEKNDFNDIVQYLPSRIPFFINRELSYRIVQIGKILIFLAKYCKELAWVNTYSNKYSHIIFQSNQGLKSFSPSSLTELINLQYGELMNYFTIVIQGPKNELAQHLRNFKKVYFIQNNDFIDSIITNGIEIFNESSTNISSNYLSKILMESINSSSIRHSKYAHRLDARVLDPVHGNIGWEVFTLEYRIEDLPISTLLEKHMMQYLKMFNFLWRLRHLQHLLNEHSLDCYSLRKNELRKTHAKYLKIKRAGTRLSTRDTKIVWLIKSFNTINMIRLNLTKFLNALVHHISFDVIEDSFDKLIDAKLFKSNDLVSEEANKQSSFHLLNTLNPKFLGSLKGEKRIGLSQDPVKTKHNMNELTFDEIIGIHQNYLNKIVNNKLISDDAIGKGTRSTYIEQVYSLLEVIFLFYKSAEEYTHLIVGYVLINNVDGAGDENMLDVDSLQDTEAKLQAITTRIYKDIYFQFQTKLDDFVKDLKMDYELKPLVNAFV